MGVLHLEGKGVLDITNKRTSSASHIRNMLDGEFIGSTLHIPVYGNGYIDVCVESAIKPSKAAANGQSGVYLVRPFIERFRDKPFVVKVYGDIAEGSPDYMLTYFTQASILRSVANAATKNRHPNVLPYFGDYYDPEHALAVFALGHVASKKTVLDALREGCYSFDDVLSLGITLFRTIDDLGKQGIIHRDIKPQNILQPADVSNGRILRTYPDQLKLFDFDVAWYGKYVEVDGNRIAGVSGNIIGSPGYISPEMWRSESSFKDPKGDVFSACVTIVETMTGQGAWKGYSNLTDFLLLTSRAAKKHELPNNLQPFDDVTAQYGNPGRHVCEALYGGLRSDPRKRLSAALIARLFEDARNELDAKSKVRIPTTASNVGKADTVYMDAEAAHTILMEC